VVHGSSPSLQFNFFDQKMYCATYTVYHLNKICSLLLFSYNGASWNEETLTTHAQNFGSAFKVEMYAAKNKFYITAAVLINTNRIYFKEHDNLPSSENSEPSNRTFVRPKDKYVENKRA
jgi:hypothetical protein